MQKLKRLCNIICKYDVYRVRNWFYYIGFPIIGLLLDEVYDINVWFFIIINTIFVLALVYSLNDYADADITKKYFIFPLFLFLMGFFFLENGTILALFLFILFGFVYSFKPFRFKRMPFIGTLCNALAFPQLFLAGYWYEYFSFDFKGLFIFLFLFLLSFVVQILHEVSHRKRDKREALKTTANFLVDYQIKIVCIIFLIGSFFLSFFMYKYNWIHRFVFLSFLFFHTIMIFDIIFSRLQYRIWRDFRILGVFIGMIWFFSFLYRFS